MNRDMQDAPVVMPPEPSEGALEAIRSVCGGGLINSYSAYHALRAYLAEPRTRTEWVARGWDRTTEPKSHTLTADSQAELVPAINALFADGFGRVDIWKREVPV